MNCPNCYTQGLTPRTMRCPRCDWLLLDPPAPTASAARPLPPVTNPWTASSAPELPVMPGQPAPEQQLAAQWGQGPGAPTPTVWGLGGQRQQPMADWQLPPQSPLPPAPTFESARMAMRGDERWLIASHALSPLLLLGFVGFVVARMWGGMRDLFELLRDLNDGRMVFWLVLAVVAVPALYRLGRATLYAADALSGEVVRETDRMDGLGVAGEPRFQRIGKLRVLGQRRPSLAQGRIYRLRYAPFSRVLFSAEPLDGPPGSAA